MKRNVYMVVSGSRFGITTNRSQAVRTAKQNNGKVYAMSLSSYRDGGSWDCPTFMACADSVVAQ